MKVDRRRTSASIVRLALAPGMGGDFWRRVERGKTPRYPLGAKVQAACGILRHLCAAWLQARNSPRCEMLRAYLPRYLAMLAAGCRCQSGPHPML